jgi:hypothetical protein
MLKNIKEGFTENAATFTPLNDVRKIAYRIKVLPSR